MDARGNISVKQEGKSEIGMIRVNRKIEGSIELNLEGFNGNLVVNTISNVDIAIVIKGCNIPEATISGDASGQKLSITDNTANGTISSVGKINVESSAQVKIDVPANELEIAETTSNASVTIDKPIGKFINSGAETNLTVNSNISNVVSIGSELNMKVAAGSTVKDIKIGGTSSKIDVALGSTIENIVVRGNESSITERGKVNTVKVEGNNTKIETRDSSVSVGKGATGTVNNGKEIEPGTVITPTAPTRPDPTPTSPSIPRTGEVITIGNPGNIWIGKKVRMTANYGNIRWSVYNYIEGSGYATINASTGVLNPIGMGTVRLSRPQHLILRYMELLML